MSDGMLDREQMDRAIRTVLKATREDLDITQKEFARRLGWTQSQFGDLEAGRRVIRAADLFLIAQALDVVPNAWIRRIERWVAQPLDATAHLSAMQTSSPNQADSFLQLPSVAEPVTKSAVTERERLERTIRIVLCASRMHSEVSPGKLAETLGWTRAQVSSLETGRRRAMLTDFLMIAKALNIDPIALLQRVLRW